MDNGAQITNVNTLSSETPPAVSDVVTEAAAVPSTVVEVPVEDAVSFAASVEQTPAPSPMAAPELSHDVDFAGLANLPEATPSATEPQPAAPQPVEIVSVAPSVTLEPPVEVKSVAEEKKPVSQVRRISVSVLLRDILDRKINPEEVIGSAVEERRT